MTNASRDPCAGWAGVKNGALLKLAAQAFDAVVTVDRNLQYQQNLAGLEIAVVIVHAPSNDVSVLRPLMPEVREALAKATPGKVTHVRVAGLPSRHQTPSSRRRSSC